MQCERVAGVGWCGEEEKEDEEGREGTGHIRSVSTSLGINAHDSMLQNLRWTIISCTYKTSVL